MGEPYSVAAPLSYFALPAASVKSVIGHYYADLALGASREFALSRVSEEFNLHSTPQLTLRVSAGYGNLKR